jgi:hypothetical protein
LGVRAVTDKDKDKARREVAEASADCFEMRLPSNLPPLVRQMLRDLALDTVYSGLLAYQGVLDVTKETTVYIHCHNCLKTVRVPRDYGGVVQCRKCCGYMAVHSLN